MKRKIFQNLYKNKIFIIIILTLILFGYNIILAHKGKIDSNGGHYDRSTGEYHYHHGYPAHQHVDGICPYEYKDNTSENIEKNTENESNSKNTKTNSNTSIIKKDNNNEHNINKLLYDLTYKDCIVLTILTYILCILLGMLTIFILKKIPEFLKNIIDGILIFSSLVLFIGIFYTPSLIFNSYKNNTLQELIFPCLNIIFLIPLIHLIVIDKKIKLK